MFVPPAAPLQINKYILVVYLFIYLLFFVLVFCFCTFVCLFLFFFSKVGLFRRKVPGQPRCGFESRSGSAVGAGVPLAGGRICESLQREARGRTDGGKTRTAEVKRASNKAMLSHSAGGGSSYHVVYADLEDSAKKLVIIYFY